MKIAVCVSGQPRFFEKAFEYIDKNLLKNFETVDVFFHCWENILDDSKKTTLLNLYNPKKFLFEKEKIHILNYPFKQSTTQPNSVFSMFYSIMKSNNLKKDYEQENDFKYDWVFRLRFDFALNKSFNKNVLLDLDSSYIYLNNFEQLPNPHCADCFAFSTSKNMNIYSETYNNIMKYGYRDTILAGEAMLYKQIIENNIQIKAYDINHTFNPDYKTCFTKNSLIRQ